jgi:hypothetical protein
MVFRNCALPLGLNKLIQRALAGPAQIVSGPRPTLDFGMSPLAHLRHAGPVGRCPLLGEQRKWLGYAPRSQFGTHSGQESQKKWRDQPGQMN